MQFSVLTNPVIPVLTRDGEEGELGIRAVFEQAHELRDLRGDTPLERYALLRLLVAFAMDMLELENARERKALLKSGRFDMDVFDSYVEACEKNGSSFDLFDKNKPFLQSAYDRAFDAKAEKPVACLFQTLPTGNNHVFLDHRMENDHEVSVAQAFGGMCALYLFCTAAAQGYPSSVNNIPPVYAIALGNSLFETIVFNILSKRECGNISYGLGDVPWREAESVVPKKEYPAVTMLGGLTWMPRRITLMQQNNGMVKRVYLQQGKNFKGNDLWKDPHVPYRKKKDGTFASVKPEAGRAFWRDVGTMIYDPNGMQTLQPLVLKLLENVFELDTQPVSIRATGLVTNQASIVQWQEDELRIPAALLRSEVCAMMLREDIAQIETAQQQISIAIRKRLDDAMAEETKTVFLRNIQNIVFGECMDQILAIESAEDIDEAIEEHEKWLDDVILKEMMQAIKQVIEPSGNDYKAMLIHEDIRKDTYYGYKRFAKGGRA